MILDKGMSTSNSDSGQLNIAAGESAAAPLFQSVCESQQIREDSSSTDSQEDISIAQGRKDQSDLDASVSRRKPRRSWLMTSKFVPDYLPSSPQRRTTRQRNQPGGESNESTSGRSGERADHDTVSDIDITSDFDSQGNARRRSLTNYTLKQQTHAFSQMKYHASFSEFSLSQSTPDVSEIKLIATGLTTKQRSLKSILSDLTDPDMISPESRPKRRRRRKPTKSTTDPQDAPSMPIRRPTLTRPLLPIFGKAKSKEKADYEVNPLSDSHQVVVTTPALPVGAACTHDGPKVNAYFHHASTFATAPRMPLRQRSRGLVTETIGVDTPTTSATGNESVDGCKSEAVSPTEERKTGDTDDKDFHDSSVQIFAARQANTEMVSVHDMSKGEANTLDVDRVGVQSNQRDNVPSGRSYLNKLCGLAHHIRKSHRRLPKRGQGGFFHSRGDAMAEFENKELSLVSTIERIHDANRKQRWKDNSSDRMGKTEPRTSKVLSSVMEVSVELSRSVVDPGNSEELPFERERLDLKSSCQKDPAESTSTADRPPSTVDCLISGDIDVKSEESPARIDNPRTPHLASFPRDRHEEMQHASIDDSHCKDFDLEEKGFDDKNKAIGSSHLSRNAVADPSRTMSTARFSPRIPRRRRSLAQILRLSNAFR